MANETQITLVGNLVGDVELRFAQNGSAVANLTVASTPRTFDRQRNEWVDGDPLFLRCTVWREQAEHVAESLAKGMRVIVSGWLKPNNYEARSGEKRSSFEVDVQEIGPALRYATARVTRVQHSNGRGQSSRPAQQQPETGADPWAQGSSSAHPDPWAAQQSAFPANETPPF